MPIGSPHYRDRSCPQAIENNPILNSERCQPGLAPQMRSGIIFVSRFACAAARAFGRAVGDFLVIS
jgi:hypothetical protein